MCYPGKRQEFNKKNKKIIFVCLSGVEYMSSCCGAEISHLSWRGRTVSEPGLLLQVVLIRKMGRSYSFTKAPHCSKSVHTLCDQ